MHPQPRVHSPSAARLARLVVALLVVTLLSLRFVAGAGAEDITPVADPATPTTVVAAEPTTTLPGVVQDAAVTSTGSATADTGTNIAAVTAPAGTGDGTNDGGTTATAEIVTGDASGTGGATATQIAQTAAALVTDDARIEIYQMALVIQVGIAFAQSGANVALAGPSAAPGTTVVTTGSADAVGLTGSTAVTQVVELLDRSEGTAQDVSIVNVGVATANTGGNLAVLTTTAGAPTAVAVTWAPTAAVTTGDAAATGNASRTTIIQVAIGTASDDGTIRITQTAIVVNLGMAVANSGGNTAAAGADDTALVNAVINALVVALLQSGGLALPALPADAVAASDAAISTGAAGATGNAHDTTITQQVTGSVHGNTVATADQRATVGNLGIALANTGLDGPTTTDADQTVIAIVDALTQLVHNVGESSWTDTMDFGNTLLQTYAQFAVLDAQLADVGPSATDARVRIRQVVGVLNLMFTIAVSGSNAAIVDRTSALAVGTARPGARQVGDGTRAEITTGAAHAVGNDSHISVCQEIHTQPSVCEPEPTTTTTSPEPVPPTTPAEPGHPLAFTGAGSAADLAAFGAGGAAIGLALLLAARRRGVTRR